MGEDFVGTLILCIHFVLIFYALAARFSLEPRAGFPKPRNAPSVPDRRELRGDVHRASLLTLFI